MRVFFGVGLKVLKLEFSNSRLIQTPTSAAAQCVSTDYKSVWDEISWTTQMKAASPGGSFFQVFFFRYSERKCLGHVRKFLLKIRLRRTLTDDFHNRLPRSDKKM